MDRHRRLGGRADDRQRSGTRPAPPFVRHPLPVATDATNAVVCSMAMQVIQPVSVAIAEVARVLRPGGRAVLLLPASGPLTWRQAIVYLRLQAALRRRIRYPNDRAVGARRLAATAARCALTVTSDAGPPCRSNPTARSTSSFILSTCQASASAGCEPRSVCCRAGSAPSWRCRCAASCSRRTVRSWNGDGQAGGSRPVRLPTSGGPL